MVDIVGAMGSHLGAADSPHQQFRGSSSGLNGGDQGKWLTAVMYVTPVAVLVGWLKQSWYGKLSVIVDRFERHDIMEVKEGYAVKPGFLGDLERRNAKSMVGAIGGLNGTYPALTIVSRRGDLVFAFGPKDLGSVRQAYVAISDLIA
ncbi:hypothetical protein U2F26_31610 [Micromonospora sp. 4G57]|uniref:Bacterial Pleckstrin homology domain-containing protein n=1 Tax=Micromonospora sicca TaxID=2202420 RepID=A0ABU5JMS7_9ACTN|nr:MULTISPECIES: hypothetical protein [unclassified Micromonospora]MDZ5447208.1 hypothetical protein [Micromonospora sp. 4G57]MDZ5493925.1 hypothetical protein [Micromonospora sp. 4G53]